MTIVTFDKSFPANPAAAAPYSEAGLTFTNSVGNRWASPFVNNFVGSYGSPSKLTVTPAQGKVFTLKSLQVCNANSAISPQNTVFKGTRSDGTTVSATFTTPANNTAPQTFAPPDFTNLVSLVIDLGFVAFDNLDFVDNVIPAVIIPSVGFGQNFPAGCPSVATPYTEAGLTFTNNCGNRWASPMINNFVATYGSPSKLTVTPDQGKTFTFKSLQVCNANSAISAQATVFKGTRSDGTTVSATFTTPANNTAPQTFAPPDFTNLVSLEIALGFVGFDNLVFVEGSIPSVTIPIVTFDKNFPANPAAAVPYSEAGLTFTNSVGNRWASPFVNNFVGTYGSPSKLTVTPAQGKVFTLKSLQVCNANSAISPQNTVFKGTRSDGTTVSATFTTPANNTAPQTFAPPNFTNLVSLVIDLGFVAFDNLTFIEGAIPAVIVPSIGFGQNFPAGCPSVATPYTEAGLTFTNNCGDRWASPMINNFVATYGSPSKLTVTPAQGKTFTFKSLQVCNANSAIPAQATVFTGTRGDGTTVKASFSTPASNTAPQTFAPPDFTNLVSLAIDLGFVGFDNLVFLN